MPRVRDRWRRFRFTLNNPTDAEKVTIGSYLTTTAYVARGISFIVLQTEQGNNTGTVHLQGYCEMATQKRSSAIHRIPGFERIALLGADASAQANIDYCTKVETRVEGLHGRNGTPRRQGPRRNVQRTDLIADIKAGGMTSKKVIADYPERFLHNAGNIEKMIRILQKERDFPVEVDIFFGPTGSGKSWKARHDNPGGYKVKWPENSGVWWWDFYQGGNEDGDEHDVVIMDEFRHNISYGRMLSLIDRGGFKIKYHGGMTEMNSHKIVITTNIEPENWYPKKDQEGFSMLHRRFCDFCTIYDFQRPALEHWEPEYTGTVVKQFSEIVCVRRTNRVERTVGLQPELNFNVNSNGNHQQAQENLYQHGFGQ